MEKRIAQVAVTAKVRKLYDYYIPPSMRANIAAGSRVRVPFSGRTSTGFIIKIKEETNYKGKLEQIAEILAPKPAVNEKLLTLARWISDYYLTPLGIVLKRFIPSGLTGGKTKDFEKYVKLNGSLQKVVELIGDLSSQAPQQVNILKSLLAYEKPPVEKDLLTAVGCSKSPLRALIEKEIVTIERREADQLANFTYQEEPKEVSLSDDQRSALDQVTECFERAGSQNLLLFGVNGSGKTQVYLKAAQAALDRGGEVIIAVPEISLTPQLIARFRNQFPHQLAIYHSGLTQRERAGQWWRIKNKEARIAIGVRSVIFVPFENLKLIVIDEEHERTYKQAERPPCYHLRDVAFKRAEIEKATVLMGSATPMIETFRQAITGKFQLVRMSSPVVSKRPPSIEIADMNDESGIFSPRLKSKIKEKLSRGEQIILFLNRRGFSTYVFCKNCQEPIKCPDCQVPLTYHLDQGSMLCHYCGKKISVTTCPECGSRELKFWGLGTQQVEQKVRALFPLATVERMDSDRVKRGDHSKILEAFRKGEIDILLGTQMISVGLDFPNVTLSGVIAGGTLLYMPDFRSGERTYQLISHTCGRAGRGHKKGEVIIQTHHPQHYAVRFGSEQDYDSFYQQEIKIREKLKFPPFSKLILLRIEGKSEDRVKEKAQKISEYLEGGNFQILGPAKDYPYQLRGKFRRQMLCKGPDLELMRNSVKEVLKKFGREGIRVNVEPI